MEDPLTYEDFDVASLAVYLHLTPEKVRKMADRGRLPGRRIGGGWKFSRAEIHHWFEDKIGASDENELIEVERVLEHQTIEPVYLKELLSPAKICIPLAARTKNSVIEKMCEFSAQSGSLWLAKEMADAIRLREELHPTALENGVALLHPRRPQPTFFGDPFVALGITTGGIPFGGPRGCLTDIFFLIASADESSHLRILARLSRLIQLEGLLRELRAAESADHAWQLISESDAAIE